MSERHLPALDGIRGLAIVLVLMGHLASMIHEARPGMLATLRWWQWGWTGVELFFVLSGYLVTSALLRARGGVGWVRAFYVRRALRIWPLYVTVIGVLTLAAWLVPQWMPTDAAEFRGRAGWYWLHATNLLFARDPATPYATYAFWSLALEEQFYLIWPIVVALVPPAALAWTCRALALVSLALRSAGLAWGVAPAITFHLLPTHADALLWGAALAADAPGEPTWHPSHARWLWLGGPWLIALVRFGQGRGPGSLAAAQAIGVTGASLLAVLLVRLVTTDPGGSAARALSGPVLRWLGTVSYGLYLFHWPVTRMAMAAFPRTSFTGEILGYGCTLVLAAASWRWYESRWLALKRYVPMPTRPSTLPAPVPVTLAA